MPQNLITDWKRIGTSGYTVDGRVIEAVWLEQMAANYDPAHYTALMWYEHTTWYGNLGEVVELKAEKVEDDRTALFAKLKPNDRALLLNKEGQKIFTSMEVQPNFAESGEAYLVGLALTDTPASTGTDKLSFSHRASSDKSVFAFTEEIDSLEPTLTPENKESRFSKFMEVSKRFLFGEISAEQLEASLNTPNDDKDDEMNDKQFSEMMDQLKTQNESMAQTFATEVAKSLKEALKGDDADAGKTTDNTTEVPEEFTKLFNAQKETLDKLNNRLDEFETKFNKALNEEEPGTDAGEHNGSSDDITPVVC